MLRKLRQECRTYGHVFCASRLGSLCILGEGSFRPVGLDEIAEPAGFEEHALALFRWQASQNEVYKAFVDALSVEQPRVHVWTSLHARGVF